MFVSSHVSVLPFFLIDIFDTKVKCYLYRRATHPKFDPTWVQIQVIKIPALATLPSVISPEFRMWCHNIKTRITLGRWCIVVLLSKHGQFFKWLSYISWLVMRIKTFVPLNRIYICDRGKNMHKIVTEYMNVAWN